MADVGRHHDSFHKCPEITTLSEYVDGQFSQSMRERIDLHLATCPHCREDVAEFFAVVALLRRLHEPITGP